ncbi:MAG: efflux RND transporter permease subunit [Gemmatimonadota bacterium]
MTLPDLSLRRPVAISMLFVAVGVLGVVSFTRLPIDLLPDVAFPTLSVWTTYSDAGPAEVERFVTEGVEGEMSQVPGVRKVTSRSREGQSLVQLRFDWGTDMEFATLHVRERLDNIRENLPEGADRPVILRSDPTSDPILTLAVSGADLRELRNLSEAVFKRRLEQLDGVALAAVTGGPERELQVLVDPGRLSVHGLTIERIAEALDRANWNAGGGMIRRGRFYYSLRTLGQFTDVDQLREVVVKRPEEAPGAAPGAAGGSPVLLRDVAEVKDTIAELETLARYNGAPAVGLQVYKEAGSNTVRVADRVDEVVTQLREEFPEVRLELAASQATFIRDAITNVIQALLVGGFLAFLVLFLFLRDPRYPLAVGLAIPISVMAAFALCYLFDVSLNIMSLGGLALGVGLLVDNSIVVLENIFRHREEEGREPREAASAGAREVAAAITASTLTTIAVFGPVLYVKGVAGALFADLSLAVTFSLLASLLVALTLLPVLAARAARRRATGSDEGGRGLEPGGIPAPGRADREARPRASAIVWAAGRAGARSMCAFFSGWLLWLASLLRFGVRLLGRGLSVLLSYVGRSVRLTLGELARGLATGVARLFRPVLDGFDRGFRRLAARYERGLRWALDHRPTVLGLAAAGLLAAVLVGSRLPRGLMPRVDEGEFRVELELPVGTPLAVTEEAAERLERTLLELDEVDGVFARVGRARGSELVARELTGLNSAALEVRLKPGERSTPRVVEAFRRELDATGVDPRFLAIETGRATSLGRVLALGEADLAVKVQGSDLEALVPVAESVSVRLRELGEISDVRIDLQRTQPEVEVRVDQEAVARHGLAVRDVADAVEAFLRGRETEQPYAEFSDKITIRVELPEAARRELADVLDLKVEGVPIGELVSVRQGYGPVEIRREDQNRTVQVLADVRRGGLGGAVRKVEDALAEVRRPPLTSVRVGGENEEMLASFRSLLFAFGLALFLVFLIMAAEFESLIQPLVVLTSVPLAALGAVLALALTGGGLNAMSGIGLVILVGIVVNDAIIKVDFINQRRRAGLAKRAAILEAGRLRLRPIIMTTVTTVVGLLPLALGWGAGADLRAPLAVAVIGGLISATVLTLLVVPVVYSLVVEPGVAVGAGSGPGGEAGLTGRESAAGTSSGPSSIGRETAPALGPGAVGDRVGGTASGAALRFEPPPPGRTEKDG